MRCHEIPIPSIRALGISNFDGLIFPRNRGAGFGRFGTSTNLRLKYNLRIFRSIITILRTVFTLISRSFSPTPDAASIAALVGIRINTRYARCASCVSSCFDNRNRFHARVLAVSCSPSFRSRSWMVPLMPNAHWLTTVVLYSSADWHDDMTDWREKAVDWLPDSACMTDCRRKIKETLDSLWKHKLNFPEKNRMGFFDF